MNAVLPAIVAGVFSIIVALIAANSTAKSVSNTVIHQMQTAQAVTDTKIEELTREVREHNGFARRLPVVENEIKNMNERIDKFERGA